MSNFYKLTEMFHVKFWFIWLTVSNLTSFLAHSCSLDTESFEFKVQYQDVMVVFILIAILFYLWRFIRKSIV